MHNQFKKFQKRPIRAFVIGKKSLLCIFCMVLGVCIVLLTGFFRSNTDRTLYGSFLKFCCRLSMPSASKEDNAALDILSKLDAGMVMAQCSPVFSKGATAVSVFNQVGADQLEAKAEEEELLVKNTTANPEKAAVEKSYPSYHLDMKNETAYPINAAILADTVRTYRANGDKPKVLILHTHACECYTDDKNIGYPQCGNCRTTETKYNMVKIGDVIEAEFKNSGINVIHDKTLNDYPSYNSSYKKALGVIEWYLNRYPSIEFVFDIHRDAIADADGTPIKLSCTVNGQSCAQAMIVCGTDAMGLNHPYWKDNLILALKIQKNAETMYPGFMRPVNLRKERFNMHKTKGSLIFEIGTHKNTLEEAILGAENLSKVVAKTLNNA